MTIARKLWLGFGVLILMFLLACLIIFFSERAVNRALDEINSVEEPTRAASYEMEINVAEMARDVLDYQDTGDARYREQFEDNRADFERFKDRYDGLVDTERGEEHGERIEALYEEYAALGDALTDGEPSGGQGGALGSNQRRFLELQGELDAVFDEEVQPWTAQQLEESERDAGGAIRGVYLTLALLFFGGLLVGVLAAYLINRGVIGSVRRLEEGVDRVGRGDLDHRIEVDTRDELGAVAAAFNAMLDRRREAEEALRKSEARTRAIVETTPDAIITMTKDGTVRSFNPGAERIFGYSAEEIVGLPMRTLMPERFRGAHEEGFRRYLSGAEARVVGKGAAVELAGLRKDGTEFPLDLSLGEMREEGDILFTGIVRDITERKRAEEELRESEERYRLVAQATNEAIWDSDILADRQTWNGAVEAMFGYLAGQETDGAWWEDHIHPDDRGRVVSSINETLDNGEKMWTDEYRFRRADGAYVTVVDRAYLVRDTEGRPVRMIGSMADTTDRKRAEAALVEAEARYRTVVEQIPAVIYLQDIDHDGATTYVSPQIEGILGYTPQEYTTDPYLWVEILHPEDRERVLAEDTRTDETGESFKIEYRVLHRDGRTVWVRDEAVIVRDEHGTPLLWQGFMQDITEEREAEKRVRDAEVRYRALVENIPAVVYMQQVGAPSLTTYVSPQIEAMQGYTSEETLADPEHWTKTLHPEDRERVLAEDARTNETGEPFVMEYRQITKDGRWVWVRDEAVIVRDDEGNPLHWQGVLLDVTERKAAEEAVRENEKRFRQLFDQSVDSLFVYEASGKIVDCNAEACRSLGYNREELLSLRIQDLATDLVSDRQERPSTEPTLWQRALAGEPGQVAGIHEGEHRRKDGTTFPVEVYVGSVDYGGERMIFASARDITERRRAEEALRQSEERYRLVAQATNEVIWDNDLTTNAQVWDGATEAMFGYSPTEMGDTAEWWEEHLHPDDRDRVLANTEAALRSSGDTWIDEYRFRSAEGVYVTVVDRAYLVRDAEGRPVRMLGSMADITERKRAEEALRQETAVVQLLESVAITANEAPSFEEALQSCLELLWAHTEWPVGHAYLVAGDPARKLISTDIWHLEDPERFENFVRTPEGIRFASGVGLPGRVLASRKPAWIKDVSKDPNFSRAKQAKNTGIRSGFAFPVMEGREVAAVLEFFSTEIEEPNQQIVEVMAQVGTQLGRVVERERFEEALRESEERYRTLVETVQEGIAFIDPEGGVVNYCNVAYAKILGLTPEEMVGKSFFDSLEGEEREKALRQRELRHEGESSSYEVTATAADGTEKVLSATGSPIFDAEGSYAGAVQTIVDVTERRRAERELREAEELFRSAFDDAAVGMALNDLDGRFTQVNRSLCEMLGYTEEELLGLTFKDISHPDDLDVSVSRVRELLEGEIEGYQLEKRYLCADGRTVWAALSVSAVRDPEENPLYMIAQMQDITERREAEAQLRKSQVSLAEAQRMAHIGNWEYDLTTYEVSWSDEVFRIYGHAPQEFVPTFEGLLEIVHPDDRHLLSEGLDGAVNRGEPYDFEHRIVLPDGAERVVHRRARVVRDEDGRPLRLVGTVQDITERKRAEEEIRELNESLERRVEERTAELRESEERYSLVVEGSNDGIFDWDLVEDTLFWNDRLFEMLGLSRSTFTPTLDAFFDLVRSEDRERVSENLTAHLERSEEFEVAFDMRHAGGGYRTCVARGKAQRDEDGRPFRMAGTLTDITERKRAEEKLRLRDRAIAASSNGIVISDPSLPDNPLIYVNPAFEAMTGYTAEEAVGRNCRFLQGSDRDQPAIDELRAALREGRERQVVLRNYRKDGSLFYNELSVSPVRDEAGNVTHFVGVQTDVTERKRAEEEIRELNESLERRVEERTAQLQNAIFELERAGENLRGAKEEAESANRAKSEFLANMSHEIRTPMNGVIGMTELLLDTSLDGEQREYASTVRLSGESLLSIINDILDFSKIEAGEMRLETIDFDLRTAVEDVVALFAERAHDKGLELASLVDYDVPTALEGDPGRIRQILTNLVGNAIKFTEEGEVVLRAELAEEGPERATVRISVKDTGIGMTEEQQSRVFESFSQADASTTRRYGGTGLGLTISRQMVELMGGEIGVESEPDVGSTFYFTLPLKKQPGEAPRAPGPLADLTGLRVLVVDDNDTNRQILHRQLSSWGMESGEARDGFAALDELRSASLADNPYDLAILDMQMPGMDGLQLASRISGDQILTSTRLVLLTSIGRRGDGAEVRQVGVEAYLTKPVRQSELYDAIATVMGIPEATRVEASYLVTRHTLREMHTDARAHLLLAEDNPVNQKVAARMLERLGYRVDVAQNGLETLEALARNRYAAVLMDVQMPEMDGYEATAEIRRREREAAQVGGGENRAIPIIAMTANAMQGDREEALAAGMDDYLAKPVRQEELEETLGRWIAQGAAGDGEPITGGANVAELEARGDDGTLDPEVLAGLRELGDTEILSELAEMFLDDASSRLAALQEAVESGDAQATKRVAHTLKGSSGNMGATRMAAICAEVEEAGSSSDLTRVSGLLERLKDEFGRVRPALEAEVEKTP